MRRKKPGTSLAELAGLVGAFAQTFHHWRMTRGGAFCVEDRRPEDVDFMVLAAEFVKDLGEELQRLHPDGQALPAGADAERGLAASLAPFTERLGQETLEHRERSEAAAAEKAERERAEAADRQQQLLAMVDSMNKTLGGNR